MSSNQKSIAFLRMQGRVTVNAAAGRARARYLTDIAGQDIVYAAKEQQARAYRATVVLGVPTGQPGAYLAAEAAATNRAALAVADSVISAATTWSTQTGPAIEGARMRGLAAINAATTSTAIDTAVAAAISALSAL